MCLGFHLEVMKIFGRVKQKLSRNAGAKGQESGSGGTNLTENEAGVEERGRRD